MRLAQKRHLPYYDIGSLFYDLKYATCMEMNFPRKVAQDAFSKQAWRQTFYFILNKQKHSSITNKATNLLLTDYTTEIIQPSSTPLPHIVHFICNILPYYDIGSLFNFNIMRALRRSLASAALSHVERFTLIDPSNLKDKEMKICSCIGSDDSITNSTPLPWHVIRMWISIIAKAPITRLLGTQHPNEEIFLSQIKELETRNQQSRR
ncbi:hypothetical protein ACJX0J_020537, partial [Zea mays]